MKRNPSEILLATLRFAAEKHSGQRRKDSAGSPYINHPIAVAELLSRVGRITDLAILQAAILHDTLEDTATTARELDKYFGRKVRKLVQEVTDDKSLPTAERKRLQIVHALHISKSAQQIKMADKICNLGDITLKQPVDWPLKRKREYVEWGAKVVAGCRGCNRLLERYFDVLLKAKRKALG